MKYDEKVVDHYENPRNVGVLDAAAKNVGTGVVGSPACGDVIKLQILVDEDDRIQEARFKTFGCGSAIAVSSLLTESIKGKTLEEAQKVRNSDLSEALQLPDIKRHCSVLAEEVLSAAIQDFRKKQTEEKAGVVPADLTLTPRAIEKARFFCTRETPPAAGLRVSVVRRGCAGLSYVLDCAKQRDAEEVTIDAGGVLLFVDPLVMPFLQGTQIDYVEENLKAGFVFNNPNACAQCSCGQSFRTEKGARSERKPGACGTSACMR